ncbi:hypothetical protein OHA21_16290 [Actinoplanes sp. NBC_00393]
MAVKGEGAVQADGGDWEPATAGQVAHWRAGEEHTTRAVTDLMAVAVEVAGPQ